MDASIRVITDKPAAATQPGDFAISIDLLPEAALIFRPDGTIVHANRVALRLFEADSLEQLITHNLYSIGDLEPQRSKDAVEQLHAGKTIRFEMNFTTLKGKRRILDIVAVPMLGSDGGMELIFGVGHDITEFKDAQREQALQAAVLNSSNDSILSLSNDMKIVSWNPASEKLYGYAAEEVMGRGLEAFVDPDELSKGIAAGHRLAETGVPEIFEQRGLRKDGVRFDSQVNIFLVRDAAGEVIGMAGVTRDISPLKQIQNELREAHEYTRGLIESSIDAMVVVDRELRITDANEELARLTQIPKSVLIGSRFDCYFSDSGRASAAIQTALADGYVKNYDLVLRAGDGSELLVSFNASIFYRGGNVFGIFGVARDVTAQRGTERKLEEERQYSRRIVECTPDALLIGGPDLVLTDVNEQARQLTGYSRQELVGIDLSSLFSDPDRAREVVGQALETDSVREIELNLLTRNAENKPVSLNVAVFKDSQGSARGVVVGIRDIAERQRYEKERSLLASIVDSSGDAIYTLSRDLIVTSWNEAAQQLFGYTAAEIIGRSGALLVPLDRRSEVKQYFQEIAASGKSARFETQRMHKDGSLVSLALTVSPIFDSSRQMAAISITARDISERQRFEAELTKARDGALEAARLKSEFLANMSHEIRTPLNSVIGMTNLLLESELSPEQREFAGDVRDSGETLLSLINEILDFSKIASGKLVFEEVGMELTPAVEGAIEMVADQARRKGLELTVAIDAEAPEFVRGDPGRLRQVLLNLLSNAIKFTERGEVAVKVDKLSENAREAILRFEVRDTGIGIPRDKQHLLFQPFTQVDASTTRHFGGTGLGLSIARELVERMGGTIAVSSSQGAGSTFWFTAKFAKQAGDSRPVAERFVSLEGVGVLIVDDNPNSREILRRQVCSWGMEADTAASAQEALAALRADGRRYPVAVIDVMMPEVDGVELTRMIKSDPALSAMTLVLVSSVGSRAAFTKRLTGLEVAAWLMKPVPQSMLYNTLAKALGRTAEPQPQRVPPDGVAPNGIQPLPLACARALRVLVAEDNPINQKLARLMLAKFGADVTTVANGREAVEAVSRFPYDVVFMDCQMPEMDGYDASREIRRREGAGRHTRIVALTAHALEGDRDKCLDAGMDAYITKPLDSKALETILREIAASLTPHDGTDASRENGAKPPQ